VARVGGASYRVSTQDQHLTGQLEALKAAGASKVYREKVSGVRADRPQLATLMAALKPGDVVVVTKLDRLGRSTRELLKLIERIKQGWCCLPIARGSAVGYVITARPIALDAAGRHRGIRA
jgi:Resolvase, N terminal domain